jgi:hypothetical protein
MKFNFGTSEAAPLKHLPEGYTAVGRADPAHTASASANASTPDATKSYFPYHLLLYCPILFQPGSIRAICFGLTKPKYVENGTFRKPKSRIIYTFALCHACSVDTPLGTGLAHHHFYYIWSTGLTSCIFTIYL